MNPCGLVSLAGETEPEIQYEKPSPNGQGGCINENYIEVSRRVLYNFSLNSIFASASGQSLY